MEELYEYLRKTLSNEDTLQFMSNLAVQICTNHNLFLGGLYDFVEEKGIETLTCPECFNKLSKGDYTEYHGERHGFPSYESVTIYKCNTCGWDSEDL